MRRSGSSSCMLRPKGSYDSEEKCNGEAIPSLSMSVTLLSTEQLPSYSSERFFMLSELEIQGHSSKFLCDLDAEESTNETEASSTASTTEGLEEQKDQPVFSSFNIVYILWRPDMTSSAKVFTETTILETVNRMKSMVEIVPSTASKSMSGPPAISPTSVTDNRQETTQPSGATESHVNNKATSIYLVVDRVAPEKQSWWPVEEAPGARAARFHQVEQNLAEELARQVAGHPVLRSLCEGVTIGVSNHERAAPGLEACVNALMVGAKDRRQHCSSKNNNSDGGESTRSLIGLVVQRPDDCLGLQSERVTDAAQGVLQNRVCAEWNGQGNLITFARRANAAWRLQHGLLPEPDIVTEPKRRRVPRVRPKPPELEELHELDEAAMDRELKEKLVNIAVGLFLGLYIAFHFMDELRGILWVLHGDHWETLAEKLREL